MAISEGRSPVPTGSYKDKGLAEAQVYSRKDSPKLTDRTKSHVATQGWEDGIGPANTSLEIPHRTSSFAGGKLSEFEKDAFVRGFIHASQNVPRGTIEKEAGLMKNLAIGGALASNLAGAANAMNVSKALQKGKPAIQKAVKSTASYKSAKDGANKLKDKVLGKAKDSMGLRKAPGQSGSVSSGIQEGFDKAKDIPLTGKDSPVKAKLKNMKQLQMSRGGLSGSVDKNGRISASYKDLSAAYKDGKISAKYQLSPSLALKGFAGKGDSGGSFFYQKSF